MVSSSAHLPTLQRTQMDDEAALASQKPVMSLPQCVSSLSVLCYSVFMSFPPFPPKCSMD